MLQWNVTAVLKLPASLHHSLCHNNRLQIPADIYYHRDQ